MPGPRATAAGPSQLPPVLSSLIVVSNRPRPGEFRSQRRVENAPVRTDIAFEKLLRLIDRLDDVVVYTKRIGTDHEVPQDHRLTNGISLGPFKIVSLARPAEFADHDFLVRISGDQSVVELYRFVDGDCIGYTSPIGEDVGEDLVDGINQFWMLDEELPVISGGDRYRTRSVAR